MKYDIDKYNPCHDGHDYYDSQPDTLTAWNNCKRGDWMLWIAGKLRVDERLLILAASKCAETAIFLMKDQRLVNTVKTAIDYGNGLIDKEQLQAVHSTTLHYVMNNDVSLNPIRSVIWIALNATDTNVCNTDIYSVVVSHIDDTVGYATHIINHISICRGKEISQSRTVDICREVLIDAVFAIIK